MSEYAPALPWVAQVSDHGDVFIMDANTGTVALVYQSYALPMLKAAPDLLEAAEAAVRCLEALPHSWGCEFAELPKIRAAIAKAKL